MAKTELTQDRLKQLVSYEPESGVFTRLTRTTRAPAGAVAGYARPDGYVRFRVDGVEYWAHRLAWLYVHGEWPAGQIDHKDRNPSNNAITNLRDVTQAQNNQNILRPHGKTISGARGVSWYAPSGRWRSRISVNGRERTVGYFRTLEEARAAYVAAKRVTHVYASL